jgi:hypothetical protein
MFAEGDIDLYAVAAAAPNDVTAITTNALDADAGTVDNATVTFTAAATGTFWIAVYLYADRGAGLQGGVNYSLDVAVQ